VAERWLERGARILETNHGDLGAARNAAVRSTTANWAAFLDGDDLWGEAWLTRAHAAATAQPVGPVETVGPTVWHPAVNIVFGDHHSLLHHVDSTDPSFSWARFRLHNQWTALSFVWREDLVSIPFPHNDLAAGFGYEDWSWNEEILVRQGRHRIVADTCHFIHRSNQPSLLSRSQRALRTRYPSSNPLLSRPTRPSTVSRSHSGLAHSGLVSPDTHSVAEVSLSHAIIEQVRLASTIEPRIKATVDPSDPSRPLPQNFQTHTTPAQVALAQIDAAIESMSPETPLAELLSVSSALTELSPEVRALVVAEVLLDPLLAGRARGASQTIDEAIAFFPQLGG
jgi:hypothetical protein